MSQFAPVAVFAYRRTAHLVAVLDSLELCPEFAASPVYVFSDGPRDGATADVQAVRTMLTQRKRPNMTIVESQCNRGLANSIIAGVSELCDRYGRVIVIEDDLVVSPALLGWFNEALERYQDVENVWQVSGHQFAAPEFLRRGQGMFLNLSTSWGWATWARAWRGFDPAATGWESVQHDPALRRRFDLDGSYPYSEMLERQMRGEVDSWAIRWWWSMFRTGALGLFPPRPLLSNIGEDATATHKPSRLARILQPAAPPVMTQVPEFPPAIAVDVVAQRDVHAVLRRARRPVWQRALAAVLG
jgi:hypothetical protein